MLITNIVESVFIERYLGWTKEVVIIFDSSKGRDTV